MEQLIKLYFLFIGLGINNMWNYDVVCFHVVKTSLSMIENKLDAQQ